MDLIKEYLKLTEDFDLCTMSYLEFAVKAKNITEDYHNEKLLMQNFNEQSELLITFFKHFRDNGENNIGMTIEQFVDDFLNIKKK